MKATQLLKTTLAVSSGLLLGLTSARSGEVVISNFDSPSDATLWYWENWSSPAEVAADATLDAGGGATQGSLRVTNNFPDNPNGYSQAVVTLNLNSDVNAEALYSAISFDIKLDPSSYPRVDGVNYGGIEIIFRNGSDWTWNSLGFVELTAAHNNWTHLSFPVKAPGDKVHHLTLKLGQNNLTNTVIYNVDNLRWTEFVQETEVVVNNFDSSDETDGWYWENWSIEALIEYDAVLDAGGGAVPGSMRVTNLFPDNPGGYNQAVISRSIDPVDAETLYTKISFDVRLDPSSYPRVDGVNYGGIEMIFRNGSDWNWNSQGYLELTLANANWTHVSFPVKAPADAVHHLTLKLGQNNLTNTVVYNVDNIRWSERAAEQPRPTNYIEKAKAGLNLIAGTGGQWDRQNIKSVGYGYGWIGSTEPVSYSVTIAECPDPAKYPGFQTHIYLVPGTPGTESAPDWNEPTAALIPISADTNGVATMTFRYKTNAPGSNGPATLDGLSYMYFNAYATNGPVGELGSVQCASISGTWTVTFEQDTQITLKAPDGATSSFAMPAEDAAQFAGDITAYFGVMPGNTAYIGQASILRGAKIASGATALLQDNFTVSPLNPDLWTVAADSATCVALVTPSDLYWVSWTTPSSGFTLQANAGLDAAGWVDLDLTPGLLGTHKRVLIPSTALPSAKAGFFRLIKLTP